MNPSNQNDYQNYPPVTGIQANHMMYPAVQYPSYYYDWMYYNQMAAYNNQSNDTLNQNEFQGTTPNMFIPPQSTPIDQSYYYSYQMAQYYQQQAFYYQQYYEHLQQQQQHQMPTPQLDEIELDAIKEDNNFNQIQKIIKNNEQTLLFNRCKTHVKGVFSMNKMIKIEANNPRNGEPALVEIHNLYDIVEDYLNEDVNYKILKEYPGPLKRVGTETTQLLKGTIIQYCQKKAKDYLNINNQQLLNDSQSYSLIWDYLSLLVRQNGEIDLKTDLSSLLLNDNETWSTSTTPIVSKDDDYRSNTPNSEINSLTDNLNNRLKLNDDEILTKLRQLLSIGQRLDAIEWSIKHNLWSHAFFIATTTQNLDVKLIDKIKLKFINSFLIQDPLKTCYQLYIGRSPTIPINLIEWNDWRRHLAIILSNKDSFNKDIVLKSIKSIADSLSTNNRVAASHFCYLLANVQFGEYKKKSSKIVLIGSSHENDFDKFCDLTSIQATEIYEYAKETVIESFLKYKIIYTSRLCENGLLNKALAYIESIAIQININPNSYLKEISNAYTLALFLHSSVIDSKQICSPDWFQQLEMNFKNLICKTYNNKVVSIREQYQKLQNQVKSNNNLTSNIEWNEEEELELINFNNNSSNNLFHSKQQIKRETLTSSSSSNRLDEPVSSGFIPNNLV